MPASLSSGEPRSEVRGRPLPGTTPVHCFLAGEFRPFQELQGCQCHAALPPRADGWSWQGRPIEWTVHTLRGCFTQEASACLYSSVETSHSRKMTGTSPGTRVSLGMGKHRPEIPRPLKVLAMMAVGWCLAWPKALHSSSTLCPSTMMACQLRTEVAQGQGQPGARGP